MGETYRGMQYKDENKIDLFEIMEKMLKGFRETWWIFLLLAAVCTGASVLWAKIDYRPVYEASASFIVLADGSAETTAAEPAETAENRQRGNVPAEQLKATFPYILTSGALQDVVAEDLGLETIPGTISAQVLGDTNLFQLMVRADNGQTAYEILQSVIANYPKVAAYIIGNTKLKMIDETGIPLEPSAGPGYVRKAVLGFLLGTVLYMGILVLMAMTRKTVRNQHDLEQFLRIPYLGSLPQVNFKRRSSRRAMRITADNPLVPEKYTEAVDSLAVRLERTLQEKGKTSLLVTSALAGEGKTTTVCNLALILAQKGYRVLLIDGDLRNPSVAEQLALRKKSGGLRAFLAGEKEADEVICRYQESSLLVLPGGEAVREVRTLYSNGQIEKLLHDYNDQMDFILIDTPPCAMMNDASLIAGYVDAGLLVIRQDYARREKVTASAEILQQSGMELAGCTINGAESGLGSYGYGYGKYGYGYGKYGYGYGKQNK